MSLGQGISLILKQLFCPNNLYEAVRLLPIHVQSFRLLVSPHMPT